MESIMRALLVLLSTALASGPAAAEPPAWPQFRGLAGSGVAPDSEQPPTRIGPNKNVKWKVAVPAGTSSPVIVGDRLFLTGFEAGKLLTLALALPRPNAIGASKHCSAQNCFSRSH